LAINENVGLFREAQQEIIERKRAEQEIIRLNEQLEERVKIRTTQLEVANADLKVSKEKAESATKVIWRSSLGPPGARRQESYAGYARVRPSDQAGQGSFASHSTRQSSLA
jgi:hypothetical protein